jgi:hypothetical protein
LKKGKFYMAKELSRTAKEAIAKEVEVQKMIQALVSAGFPIERINDFGTLVYMVPSGDLQDRFITIKVVVTKEYNEETGKGFDIADAIEQYEDSVNKKNSSPATCRNET